MSTMVLIGICSKRIIHLGRQALLIENGSIHHKKRLHARTCGIIVTGDEVLRGEVQDTNSQFLCSRLHDLGVKVMKISSVPDDVNLISAEVKKFSQMYDYVLTSGGIGPTHDDVTYESVAKAFGVELKHHQLLTKICFDFFKTNDINHPAMKLAKVPVNAKLTFGFDEMTQKPSFYPNISVENVFVFPGVPHMMQKIFNAVSKELFFTDNKFYFRDLYLNVNEDKVIRHMNETVGKFPDVTIGSYPKFFHSYYSLKLTVESSSQQGTEDAFRYLEAKIPTEYLVQYDKNYAVNKREKVRNLNNKLLNDTIREVESILKSAGPDNLFLYFDGGKNSTILLYLMSLLWEEHNQKEQINCVYMVENEKVVPFIQESSINYNVNLIKLSEINFKRFFGSDRNLQLVKGTRKSDPEYQNISKAFAGYPIVNPLLTWTYKDVWDVIRGLYIPYCNLYDSGYSSICQRSSQVNPHLKTTGPRPDLQYYKKAYELSDGSLENSH